MGARERFIRSVLEEEGGILLRTQGEAIRGGYGSRTGRLLSGRRVTVTDDRLTLEHPVYERFLDIRNRRSKRLRIHNRFVFAVYSAIAGKLAAGYRDEAQEIVKKIK